jgi:hypothetical protein
MATKFVKIQAGGSKTYMAPIAWYHAISTPYILAEKPPLKDLVGITVVLHDGSLGLVSPKECLNYDQLPDNLLQ